MGNYLSCGPAKGGAFDRIGMEVGDGVYQGFAVPWRDQDTVLIMGDRASGVGGGDHRTTCRHGFEHGKAAAF